MQEYFVHTMPWSDLEAASLHVASFKVLYFLDKSNVFASSFTSLLQRKRLAQVAFSSIIAASPFNAVCRVLCYFMCVMSRVKATHLPLLIYFLPCFPLLTYVFLLESLSLSLSLFFLSSFSLLPDILTVHPSSSSIPCN